MYARGNTRAHQSPRFVVVSSVGYLRILWTYRSPASDTAAYSTSATVNVYRYDQSNQLMIRLPDSTVTSVFSFGHRFSFLGRIYKSLQCPRGSLVRHGDHFPISTLIRVRDNVVYDLVAIYFTTQSFSLVDFDDGTLKIIDWT